MKYSVLVLLLSIALVHADPFKEISSNYSKISNAKNPTTTKVELTDEDGILGEVSLTRMDSENLTAVNVELPGGDHGWVEERFYYKDGKLFFALLIDNYWRFAPGKNAEGQPNTEDHVKETRYYFAGGKCIRQLVKKAKGTGKELDKALKSATNKKITPGKEAEDLLIYSRELFALKDKAGAVAYFKKQLGPEVEYMVPKETHSPDGKLGIRIPKGFDYQESNENALVDVASGKIHATINATSGAEQQNHGGNLALWNKGGNAVLWCVDGKWFPRALVLLKTGEPVQQLNVLTLCQQEMLKRAKAKYPKEYGATKSAGGMGSAYPDGFTIDFDFDREKFAFPFVVNLSLTNDPKFMAEANEEFGKRLLEGSMKAEISQDFKVTFSDFKILATKEALKARE